MWFLDKEEQILLWEPATRLKVAVNFWNRQKKMINMLSISGRRPRAVILSILWSTAVLTILSGGYSGNSVCHAMPMPDEESFSREVSVSVLFRTEELFWPTKYAAEMHCRQEGRKEDHTEYKLYISIHVLDSTLLFPLSVRQGIDGLAGCTRSVAVGWQSMSALQ